MSRCELVKRPFFIAPLGEQTPLPDLGGTHYVNAQVHCDDTMPASYCERIGYGRVGSILPYRAQDSYGRQVEAAERDAVLLRNERVEALLLPWMGGRLWSLKVDGKELLFENPVVQPCNLALRNAWCAGGVEWNVGVRGHSMLTCEPLFTQLLSLEDGTAGVRFYELERTRGVVYRIEAYLPEGSPWLMVNVTVENPAGNGETPAYWWSNIAVPESPGLRVLAPAERAVFSTYDEGAYHMTLSGLPCFHGCDVSRPMLSRRSLDVFYDIEPGRRPFIAALDKSGRGLAQISTSRLCGRKLFLWGCGAGGRHWQEWLSHGNGSYVEIQAGLTRTQQEYLPLADGASLTWLEAYGELNCRELSNEYNEAVSQAEAGLAPMFAALDAEGERVGRVAAAEGDPVLMGSGWGWLENRCRQKDGLGPLSAICRFPEASCPKASPWRALLEEGRFPCSDPQERPAEHVVGASWRKRLEAAPQNWTALYQLGVARFGDGDVKGAEDAFNASLSHRETGWACCALARLALYRGDSERALLQYRRALALLPGEPSILTSLGTLLMQMERYDDLLALLDRESSFSASHSRAGYLRAAALIGLGRAREALPILTAPLVMPDIQEGECSFDSLWRKLQAQCPEAGPLPAALDFRMHE